jgi:hypothetical protein
MFSAIPSQCQSDLSYIKDDFGLKLPEISCITDDDLLNCHAIPGHFIQKGGKSRAARQFETLVRACPSLYPKKGRFLGNNFYL